ncbi:MAG: hypothetical protein PHO15_08280 [Eubacteriales bacterium]|nr:hypothetical protein [Eubacteriales bacterium]
MCDCQQKTMDKFKEMYPEATGITGQYEILSGQAYSVVKVQMPGKKKPKEVLLLHSYCPTCGKKYQEDDK